MHPLLAGLASSQGGVFSAEQARQTGYRDDEVLRLRASGTWISLRRGIYTEPGPEPPTEVEEHRLRSPRPASHSTRTRSPVIGRQPCCRASPCSMAHKVKVTLTIAGSGGSRAYRGLLVHQCSLAPADRTEDPPPSTVPARTLLDLARTESFRQSVVAVDSGLHLQLVTQADLLRALEACAGWPGTASARRVVAFADGRAEAPSESLARVMFAEQDLPGAIPQAEIRDAYGLVGYADFLFREQRTVVEIDGKVKYSADRRDPARALWEEQRREDRLREAGYEVVRLTWADLVHHPERAAARIRAAFARAAARRPTG
ncbi:MAG: hypothetical protein M3P96_11370 [Actinomycetota bacterium]|nr:hypothetical protein [Actinomycetota bacterium]